MAAQDELKVKLVRKMAMKNQTGQHKKQIDTVKGWVASHNEKKAENALRDMVRDPSAPVEQYGGRDVIRLTSIEDAKEFIKENGGDLPWALRD